MPAIESTEQTQSDAAPVPETAGASSTSGTPHTPYVPKLAPASVRSAQAVAVAALVGLIVLSLVWELWLAPLRPGGSWLALKALPLCLPLAGFLKNRMYTYRWVSLVVWLYFTEGVVRAWSDPAPSNWLALVEVALCLVLFTACTALIRLRLRSAPAATPAQPAL